MKCIYKLWSIKWLFIFIIIPAIALLFSPACAEPVAWFLFCLITAIVFSVKLYPHAKELGVTRYAQIIGTIVVIVIIIALFNNSQQRPSRVDVSPLAELSTEQIERVEGAIIRLENHDAIRAFGVDLNPHPHAFNESIRVYFLVWAEGEPSSLTSLHITARVFENYLQAERRERNPSRTRRFTRIEHENNTTATLTHSHMNTHPQVYGIFLPDAERRVLSSIRIGNVILDFREYRPWYALRNNYSSQFIALLVEELQEEWDWEPPEDVEEFRNLPLG